MKIKPIVFSFIVVLILALVFLLATFWIIYTHFDDATAIKDAFNTTGSYFGGIATLGAATVAAYLFNDWRLEKKYEIVAQLTLDASLDLIKAKDRFHFYLFQYIYKIDEISYKEVDDMVFHAINKLDLLNQVLIRYKMPDISNEIKQIYTQSYCNLPSHIREKNKLKILNEGILDEYSKQSFKGYDELNKKMMDNLTI